MNQHNEGTPTEQPSPSKTAPASKKRRFQIVKLEERIAPDKGGVTTKPHPCATNTCFSVCSSVY
jgi:hypothetical protein